MTSGTPGIPPHQPATGLQVDEVAVPADGARLPGTLRRPAGAGALVIFAHGSGSSRLSPRNVAVAEALGQVGFATLLFDLLTDHEAQDRRNVFDIPLLARRVAAAVDWAAARPETRDRALGLFGASTGAAAALAAAAALPDRIAAVVSRGGRPDLAADALPRVRAPTLLIVGGRDTEVLHLNRAAQRQMTCTAQIAIVDGATHLFEEPGALDEVTRLAAAWFGAHLGPAAGSVG